MSSNRCSHGAVSPCGSQCGERLDTARRLQLAVKSNLANARLYGIIDLGYVERGDAARIVEQMIEGGVDLIQLRGKNKSIGELVDLAAELHELAAKSSTPLIVNDYAEIARRVPVEGVHVGQDDDPIEIVRQKAGRDILVGKSTHSLDKRAPRSAKVRTTSDSARSSRLRQNLITRRLVLKISDAFTKKWTCRFSVSAASISTIYRA